MILDVMFYIIEDYVESYTNSKTLPGLIGSGWSIFLEELIANTF